MPPIDAATNAAHAATSAASDPQAARLALLWALFVMFVAAKIGAEVFERLKQPAVVGEIVAGILVGPSVLRWFTPSHTTDALAEIGVILLMFTVGLETEPRDLFKVGPVALRVAVLGVLFPFALGACAVLGLGPMLGLEHDYVSAVFVGAAMVATSVGITARVLGDMGLLSTQAARVILGAAIIDDILALLVLSIVSGFAKPEGVNWLNIAATALLALGLVAFALLLGRRVTAVAAPAVARLHLRDAWFVVSLGLCLGLALLSERIGIAAIVGAFLAGLFFADRLEQTELLHRSESLVALFLPFFLVNIGAQVQLGVLKDWRVILLALVVTLLAVAGKYWGGKLGAKSLGADVARQVGVGMVPRGEVGIVAAQIGLGLGALSPTLFAIVLFMAVATTLIAPPMLRRAFAGTPRGAPAKASQPVELQ